MLIKFIFIGFLVAIPAIIVLEWIYQMIRALVLRLRFDRNLKLICIRNDYKINRTRPFVASFFKHSSKPDLVVATPNAEYLIRFITCRNKGRSYHFPTSEYYVSSLRSTHVMSGTNLNVLTSFKHIPSITPCFLTDTNAVKKVQILLFNPSPREISYVNAEKNKKEFAHSGTAYENVIFYDASGFLDFLRKGEIVN